MAIATASDVALAPHGPGEVAVIGGEEDVPSPTGAAAEKTGVRSGALRTVGDGLPLCLACDRFGPACKPVDRRFGEVVERARRRRAQLKPPIERARRVLVPASASSDPQLVGRPGELSSCRSEALRRAVRRGVAVPVDLASDSGQLFGGERVGPSRHARAHLGLAPDQAHPLLAQLVAEHIEVERRRTRAATIVIRFTARMR